MSNFDRAVKALNDVDEAIDHLADNEAYVTALEAAGLLMPDLPEEDYGARDKQDWLWAKNGKVGVMLNDGMDSEPVVFTPEEARATALEILAACDYTEKEQNNE